MPNRWNILWAPLLTGLAFVFAYPFLWMFFATFKENLEIFTPFPLLPKAYHWDYYRQLFNGQWIPFWKQFFNTTIIACLQTLLAVGVALPVGYLLACHRFKGRALAVLAAVLLILFPRQVMILPLLEWSHALGLYNTLWGVIFPGAVSGLGVLYFILVYRHYPKVLLDLSRTEGAGEVRVFRDSLPLIRNSIWTYALVHFLLAWHEHLVPLALLSSPEKLTLTLGLNGLYSASMRMPFALLMVGSLFVILPTTVLFLVLRKQFRTSLSELLSH